jgi:hypothetical protein
MNLDELEALAKAATPFDNGWRVEPNDVFAFRSACTMARILALVRVARAAKACEKTIDALTPIKLSVELSNALLALEETQ